VGVAAFLERDAVLLEAFDALDESDLFAVDLDDDLFERVVLGVTQDDLQRGLAIWVCF
jgi:hypothetical protein